MQAELVSSIKRVESLVQREEEVEKEVVSTRKLITD